jgi:hypothetical protein
MEKKKSLFETAYKVKLSRYTPWRRLGGGGRRYSSCLFMTPALDGVSGTRWIGFVRNKRPVSFAGCASGVCLFPEKLW